MITRREALINAFFSMTGIAALATRIAAQVPAPPPPVAPTPPIGGLLQPSLPMPSDDPSGPFVLPPLPYAYDALEPYIDADTMHLHHDKHHAAYVKNLNKALADYPELQTQSIEDLIKNQASLPDPIRGAIRSQGGGHANHSLFWQTLKKDGSNTPKGALEAAINDKFGSYPAFQEQFTKAATTVFGSGWAWLTLNPFGRLAIETTFNQDSPLRLGSTPLLGIDVWEHAYYLKYQNRRPEYIAAFYNVINWEFVGSRYEATLASQKKAG